MKLRIAGINIQYPWADKLLDKEKTIETRTYDLPNKHKDEDLWVIETPGKLGKFNARVVGIIRFESSKRYCSEREWVQDDDKHLCVKGSGYEWDGKTKKYGWTISKTIRLKEPFPASDMKRGIIYSSPYEAEVELK